MDLNIVTKKLLEHDDRFNEMDQKIDRHHGEVLTRLDKLVTAVERIDQERLFSVHRLNRHEKDIDRLKQRVGLTD